MGVEMLSENKKKNPNFISKITRLIRQQTKEKKEKTIKKTMGSDTKGKLRIRKHIAYKKISEYSTRKKITTNTNNNTKYHKTPG